MPHFTGQLAPVQTSYDKVIGAGTRWVDATLGAQLTSIAAYEEERAGRAGGQPEKQVPERSCRQRSPGSGRPGPTQPSERSLRSERGH